MRPLSEWRNVFYATNNVDYIHSLTYDRDPHPHHLISLGQWIILAMDVFLIEIHLGRQEAAAFGVEADSHISQQSVVHRGHTITSKTFSRSTTKMIRIRTSILCDISSLERTDIVRIFVEVRGIVVETSPYKLN